MLKKLVSTMWLSSFLNLFVRGFSCWVVGLGVQDLGTCGVFAMLFGLDQVLKASEVGDAFSMLFGVLLQ